jgi:hypothetical protein
MFERDGSCMKLAEYLNALVFSSLAFISVYKIDFIQSQHQLVFGYVSATDGSKFSDLLVFPAVIVAFCSALFLTQWLMSKLAEGDAWSSEVLSKQFVLASLPMVASIASWVGTGKIDENLIFLSAFLSIGFFSFGILKYTKVKSLDLTVVSSSILLVLLFSLVPLEIELVLVRIFNARDIGFDAQTSVVTILFLATASLLLSAMRNADSLILINRFALPALQVGACTFYFLAIPGSFYLPDGSEFSYPSQLSLYLLVNGIICVSLFDIYRRFRQNSAEQWNSYSPFVFFALIIAIKYGVTRVPVISPDDYHFGEQLLGWWSYLHGFIPYVDYVPAHGIFEDDIAMIFSTLFYDGMAGSHSESKRLAFIVFALVAFLSIKRFSGSLLVAFVSIYLLDGRITWFFFVPFICLWFSTWMRHSPARWLVVWLLTAPLVFLGIPAQGMILILASGPIALYETWHLLRSANFRAITVVFGVFLCICVCIAVTPLLPIIIGALRHIFENASINAIAYGLPWSLTWQSASSQYVFMLEMARSSWLAVAVVCLCVAVNSYRREKIPSALNALCAFLFIVGLIPYVMGRIDPGSISRGGLVAVLSWSVLLLLVLREYPRVRYHAILAAVVFCALLGYKKESLASLWSITTQPSLAGLALEKRDGVSNFGAGQFEYNHWVRLNSLTKVLSNHLEPSEQYLDLTSRNSNYFFTNRLPPIAVTAPYNIVPYKLQMRAIDKLQQKFPKIALFESANFNFDGGGFALRSHFLYRFVVRNYQPFYENGFILGRAKKNESSNVVRTRLAEINDENWFDGMSRTEFAVVIEDPFLLEYVDVGQEIRIPGKGVFPIVKIWNQGTAIWLSGHQTELTSADVLEFELSDISIASYEADLIERAFVQKNLAAAPSFWGRSFETLRENFVYRTTLAGDMPSMNALEYANGVYSVTGGDPYMVWRHLSGISGENSGVLKIQIECLAENKSSVQVFWWGDEEPGAYEKASMTVSLDRGVAILPLDISPRWLNLSKVKGLRVDVEGCQSYRLRELSLYQR